MYDVVIIGAGPAGLMSLLYANFYGLSAICVGDIVGGKVLLAPDIQNFPSYEMINGKEFMGKLISQLEKLGAQPLVGEVTQVTGGSSFIVNTADGQSHEAKTVLIATGNGKKQKINRGSLLAQQLGIVQQNGFFVVDKWGMTTVNGVFAAGDCILFPHSLEQLMTAVSTGARAMAGIYQHLKNATPPILWGNGKIPRA